MYNSPIGTVTRVLDLLENPPTPNTKTAGCCSGVAMPAITVANGTKTDQQEV